MKMWGEVWESAWGEWGGVLGCRGRVAVRRGIWGVWGRCREVCCGVGEVSKDMWGKEKCGRVYGVSGKVCWRVGEGCRERNGGGVGKCVGAPHPNTSPSLHLPHTPTHSSTPPFVPLPHLPPHPNTLSYTYFHISPHLLKVWRSY